MFYLNVRKILEIRGVERPLSYLVKNGFIVSTAQRLVSGEVSQIRFDHLERLCLLLNCTPNDLLLWRAGKNVQVAENHPLQALTTPKNTPTLTEIIKEIPVDKLDRVAELLNELRNKD